MSKFYYKDHDETGSLVMKEFTDASLDYLNSSKNAIQTHFEREVFIIVKKIEGESEEWIEGKLTGGTGSIDGDSAVRRICSGITLVSEQDGNNFHEYAWGLKTKIKIYIGIRNSYTFDYGTDGVVYFDLGTYVLTDLSIQHNVNNRTITFSGRDRMCMLNGELGGTFMLDTELDKDPDGNTLTLDEIVINLLGLGGIDEYDITDLINTDGKELLEYRGNSPLYLLANKVEDYYEVENLTVFGDQLATIPDSTPEDKDTETEVIKESEEEKESLKLIRIDNLKYDVEPVVAKIGNTEYVQKVKYGQIAGYRMCDLIYPGGLTAAAGETITSVLDKIKNLLGAFEYYFDIDGKFWFKKKEASLQIIPEDENKYWVIKPDGEEEPEIQYALDLTTITSLSNQPSLSNFKNDFIIHGNRKSVSGENKIPIHARYSIIEWPEPVDETEGKDIYVDGKGNQKSSLACQGAYCELIYKWAQAAAKLESQEEKDEFWSHPNRKPYKGYTSDLLAFWRDIYNPLIPEEGIETTYDGVGDMIPNAWDGITKITAVGELENHPISNIFLTNNKNECCKLYDAAINLYGYPDVYTYSSGVGYNSIYNNINFDEKVLYKDQKVLAKNLTNEELSRVYIKNNWKDTDTYLPYLEFVNIYKILNENKEEIDQSTDFTYFISEYVKQYGLWVKEGALEAKEVKYVGLGSNGYIAVDSEISDSYYSNQLLNEVATTYYSTEEFYYETNKKVITEAHQFFVKRPRVLIDDNAYSFYIQVEEEYKDNDGNISTRSYYTPLNSWGIENGKWNKNEIYYIDKDKKEVYLLDVMNIDKTQPLYQVAGYEAKGVLEEEFEDIKHELYVKTASNYYCLADKFDNNTIYYIRKYELITIDYSDYFIDTNTIFVFNNELEEKNSLTEEERKYLKFEYHKCKPNSDIDNRIKYYYFPKCYVIQSEYILTGDYKGWKKAYIQDPALLPYELVLIDPNRQGDNTLLKDYTITEIGLRQKVSNDNSVTGVRFSDTPLVYFAPEQEDVAKNEEKPEGEVEKRTLFQMPENTQHLFIISSQGRSARDAVLDLLYQHSYCTENISISMLPIYDLEPNKRISIRYGVMSDQVETYIVSKINYSLTYNGMMSVSLIRDPITRLKNFSNEPSDKTE